jgi:hypothetical protein
MRANAIHTALRRLRTPSSSPANQAEPGSPPSPAQLNQRRLDLWFLTVLAVFAVPLVVAVFSDAALTWDGAYFLFRTLDSGTPFFSHDRLLYAPIHRPVLWVDSLTDSMRVLRATFGAVHVVTPLISLGLCWWVVRKEAPALVIWPLLALGMGLLPGQLFFISEGIKTEQLMWPIFLAVLVGLPARTIPMVAIVSVAMMFLHPVSVLKLGAVAAAAFVAGFLRPANRDRLFPLAGCLVVASLARYSMITSSYETGEMSLRTFGRQSRSSATGLPGIALFLTFVVAAVILGATRIRLAVRWLQLIPAALIAIAGATLTLWAVEPQRWWDAFEFRGPAMAITLALAGFAALDSIAALRTQSDHLRSIPEIRRRAGQAIVVTFAIVLSVQSVQYKRVINDMNEMLAASPSPCLPMSQLPDMPESPLNLWSTPSLSLLYQGWKPAKIVLPDSNCDRAREEGVFPLTWSSSEYRGDRIDFLPLRWQLGGQGSCWWQEESGWHNVERTDIGRRRWSPGRGVLRVFVGEAGVLSFRGLITTFRTPNMVDVQVNGELQQTIEFTSTTDESVGQLALELEAGESVIEFISRNDPAGAPGDSRDLAFSLLNVDPEFDGAGCTRHR